MGMTELLEWRDHDSASKITYTGFGPYMVERLTDDRFRAWLPDESLSARLMVGEFASDRAAREFCQRDIDGRRALQMDWQPIETAPTDGTEILCGRFSGDSSAMREGYIAVDWYRTQGVGGSEYSGFGAFNMSSWPPTHWIPLPSPPVAGVVET